MAPKKSEDAKFQLHFWSKLLEGRIALQKVISASRELEKATREENGGELEEQEDATIKSVTKLMTCLLRLRDTYRNKSQFCLNNGENVIETEDEADDDNEILSTCKVNDDLLDKKHQDYVKLRDETIQKWCEKTKIGTIPKKGYTALDVPTLQLISNALRDKTRLIRRTQLDRTSQVDYDTHPETFNDDDFYHQLLKEVISKDEGRKWVELQRMKYKIKRKADTKATKGRKVKKDLIPKLVNFMAPTRPVNGCRSEPMPDQIRDELIKSLFGGSTRKEKATIQKETILEF